MLICSWCIRFPWNCGVKVKFRVPENGRGLLGARVCSHLQLLLFLSQTCVCVCMCVWVCACVDAVSEQDYSFYGRFIHVSATLRSTFFFFNWVFFCLQTYHSLKLGASPSLCPDVFCTANGGVFVGSSVLAETITGGVDDSYPELAAGEDSDPWDSCTWKNKQTNKQKTKQRLLK